MKMRRRVERVMLYPDGTAEDIPERIQPVFSPDEPSAEVLTRYPDGSAAAVRLGKRIYIPTLTVSERMANYIAGVSGAHRYTTSREPVFTGFGYVMLNCQRAGERELLFPSGKSVRVKTEDFATVVYDIESGERVF